MDGQGISSSSPSDSVADTSVATSSQSQPSPEQHRPTSTLPRIIVVFMNGCHSRLRSVIDRETGERIYDHERDKDKPIEMSFVQGKLQSLQDTDEGHFIYIRGITHRKQDTYEAKLPGREREYHSPCPAKKHQNPAFFVCCAGYADGKPLGSEYTSCDLEKDNETAYAAVLVRVLPDPDLTKAHIAISHLFNAEDEWKARRNSTFVIVEDWARERPPHNFTLKPTEAA
ncbi:hypothetical protein F5Y00DRAFT_261303 [Daldinia vernicosa]|uniref:uncharacterized protein n=1 Tax=Daldinia vernicosa TaxID=114800 RepID=UPI0020073F16|nr:uncharacterized protein F5Y00DRAFT_261303 [Daldinia vernicosa]KAI0849855.1 hypothetical protein F5Y00DRAFT_261303 [Daldinia vernicosa]